MLYNNGCVVAEIGSILSIFHSFHGFYLGKISLSRTSSRIMCEPHSCSGGILEVSEVKPSKC